MQYETDSQSLINITLMIWWYSIYREKDKTNIHIELLSRPEREQIIWPTHYLEPERDDEKSLIKRADDLTNKVFIYYCFLISIFNYYANM